MLVNGTRHYIGSQNLLRMGIVPYDVSVYAVIGIYPDVRFKTHGDRLIDSEQIDCQIDRTAHHESFAFLCGGYEESFN